MKLMIIRPSAFPLPLINEQILLFFNLQHLYQFKDLVQGSKIKSFGPSKRFGFTYQGIPITAIGGMIGAPLAVMTLEHAIQAGGKNFLSFGSAGWIAEKPQDIGKLLTPLSGLDLTGISQDYGKEQALSRFTNLKGIESCQKIVSVNSFYRLSHDKVRDFRQEGMEMVDMESAALNQVVDQLRGRYHALFVISDCIESDYTWNNGFQNPALQRGILQAFEVLPKLLIGN